MNNTDPNASPQEPDGRTAIEREYDAIVALAIAHPDTVQVVSSVGGKPERFGFQE